VIVPLVVRRHLVDPLRHAGVRVAGEERHAPAVIAGPRYRVPSARVAAAVIEKVELGVVREPAPGRAAAELPLIAFPRGEARVLADRLAEMRRFLRIDEQLLVRPDTVGSPGFLARVDVVRDDEAAHA